MGHCLYEQLYLPCTWACYINYLIPARRDDRFDVHFPLKQLSSKYLQHELRPQRTLWIGTQITRNRIRPIEIANETSIYQCDESHSFASSDNLKHIAMTSPEVIQRCLYVSVKISFSWQYMWIYYKYSGDYRVPRALTGREWRLIPL